MRIVTFVSLITVLSCVCVRAAEAQDSIAHAQQLVGKVLAYDIQAMGQAMPYRFTIVRLASPSLIAWVDPQGNTGWLKMDGSSLAEGTYSFWQQPYAGDTTTTAGGQTVLCISRKAYQELLQAGKTSFDSQTFLRKADTSYAVSGKQLPVLHAVANETGTEIWILKDAEFPLLIATAHAPSGIDANLAGIEEQTH
ncbi:MAG: hypothetical protein IRZ29_02170 [Thermoflavifilum sp.]|nr:hypothetical protein [Thermoflavifilum sp.]